MKINYRILSVDESEHTFVVRYWTDIITEESLATHFTFSGDIVMTPNGYPERCRTDYNLNFYNNSNPSTNDVITIIKSSAPVKLLYVKEQLQLSNTQYNMSNVYNLVNITNSFEISNTVSNMY
ncbi:hypothetical protein EB001_16940 [bacterium]|nr:hypothetical protein [bacterium]